MSIMKTGLVLVSVSSAALAGHWLGQREVESARAAEVSGTAALTARLQEENARLLAETRRAAAVAEERDTAPAPVAPVVADRRTSVLTLAELMRRGDVHASPMRGGGPSLERSSNGQLPDSFGSMFSVAPAQVAELQQVIDDTRAQIQQLMTSHASARREADGSVVIDVRQPPQADAWLEHLRGAFLRVLGSEQLAAFETLSSGGVNGVFRSFKTEARTITISVNAEQTERSGVRAYNFVSLRQNGRSSMGGVNRANILRELGPLGPLLPADF